MWVGPWIIYGHHCGCLNNPIFPNLGLCAACWACSMCHQELWPTSVSHPFSSLNSSSGLTGGKYYPKITIAIFSSLVLQNFAIPGYFPYILFYRYLFSLLSSGWFEMPLSHCCEFCLRTNKNWHSLRISQYRIDSNYFILVRCHFCISSQANTNVLKCLKHSYWPCKSKPIRIASYCIAERRINSCQFLLVRISSLYILIDSLYIRTGIRRLFAATQYVAIRCATIALSYWITHVRVGSCKFLLVPIVFSSHHSAIVWILHHHCTASYCILSPSCRILLHLTASYQFVFSSCLICIDSQIVIVSNRSSSA